MNKSQLVDALADRLDDRRVAATAVDALLQIVVDTVRSGDSVSLAGFGVFESRARAARTGRNPRTGETVDVPATTVPAFRPGTGFRNAVAGGDAPARPAPRRPRAAAATNGAGGDTAVAAVVDAGNGAVDREAPPAAAVAADDGSPAAGGGKETAGRKDGPAEGKKDGPQGKKDDAKGKKDGPQGKKDDAKGKKDDDAKGGKKGKKGKK
jgi:DNA-binding protein HU-beta